VCGGLLIASSVGYVIVAAPLTSAQDTPVGPGSSTQEPGQGRRSRVPLVVAGGGAYAALACIEVAAVARLKDADSVAVGLALLSFGDWGGRWGFTATLIVSGVAVAPLLGTLAGELARRTSPTLHRSSYALLQSTSWFGAALGTAIAGLLVNVGLGLLLLVAGALAAISILTSNRAPTATR
jgi:hypothetical protein